MTRANSLGTEKHSDNLPVKKPSKNGTAEKHEAGKKKPARNFSAKAIELIALDIPARESIRLAPK